MTLLPILLAAASISPVVQPAGPPAKVVAPPRNARPAAASDVAALLRSAPDASRWPNASKATLLDLADITVRPNGTARTVTRQAIKIFTNLGREEESEVRVPYNAAFESVTIIRARTIRPDGSVLNVRPADIRTAKPSEYDDARVISISMPGVQPGCIIEYEYVTDQRSSQMPGHFWTQWYFQAGTDPVLLTRLTVRTPKDMVLQRRLRNSGIQPTVRPAADGKTIVNVWEQRNVAPFELEPMMPPAETLLPKLTLSTIPDWDSIARWYATLAFCRDTATPEIKALARKLTAGKSDPAEKARAIFHHVQERTRYVAIELGISAYQPRPASKTLRNEYGDCKDMTTLLVSLLREAGIRAWPVLLEAGWSGSVSEQLPAPSAFNHAICVADIAGKSVWLDATAQVCPFGTIPAADRGCEVLIVRDGKADFVRIPKTQPGDEETIVEAKLRLSADGSARGNVVIRGVGDSGMALRAGLRMTTRDRVKPFAEQLMSPLGSNPKVGKVELPDVANRDAPSRIGAEVSFPNWATPSGDLLLFRARPDQAASPVSSPFVEEKRRHAIYQAETRRQTSVVEILLPDGYDVLSLPETMELKGPLGTFSRTIEQQGRLLKIRIVNDDTETQAGPESYADVRTYLDAFLKAYTESIVLKRKS